MTAATATERTVRTLSIPELLTIASVIVGRMDQDAAHMAFVDVSVDLNVIGHPSVRLMIDQRPGRASRTDAVAFLNDLARAVGSTVKRQDNFHIETVVCLDWAGTGVEVNGMASVRDRSTT